MNLFVRSLAWELMCLELSFGNVRSEETVCRLSPGNYGSRISTLRLGGTVRRDLAEPRGAALIAWFSQKGMNCEVAAGCWPAGWLAGWLLNACWLVAAWLVTAWLAG